MFCVTVTVGARCAIARRFVSPLTPLESAVCDIQPSRIRVTWTTNSAERSSVHARNPFGPGQPLVRERREVVVDARPRGRRPLPAWTRRPGRQRHSHDRFSNFRQPIDVPRPHHICAAQTPRHTPHATSPPRHPTPIGQGQRVQLGETVTKLVLKAEQQSSPRSGRQPARNAKRGRCIRIDPFGLISKSSARRGGPPARQHRLDLPGRSQTAASHPGPGACTPTTFRAAVP